MKPYDLIIVGGGPAGIGAALQAGRTGRRVLLTETGALGGRLNHAFLVRNFPLGDPKGSTGRALVSGLVRQLKKLAIDVRREICTAIDFDGGLFTLSAGGHRYESRAVILAAGLEPKKLTVKGTKAAIREKRLFPYWDDIPRPLKNKVVAVIGGGEVALDQACSMAAKGAKVTVLVRNDRVRSYPGLLKLTESFGVRIQYGFSVSSLSLKGRKLLVHGRGNREFICDHAVAAIGSKVPGSILTGRAKKRLNKGLYPAGDLVNRNNRQAAIAFGSGVRAAMLAEEHKNRMKAKD